MSTTAGICNSFKLDLLAGAAGSPQQLTHVFGTDVFKVALLLATNTLTPATVSNYSSISGSELAATGNYAAGGNVITLPAPAANSNSAIVGATTAVSWANLTSSASFDGCLIYNSTKSGKAVGLYSFGGGQSITAGTLTLTMPAAAAGTALIEVA